LIDQLKRDLARVSRLVSECDAQRELDMREIERVNMEKAGMGKVIAKKEVAIKELKE